MKNFHTKLTICFFILNSLKTLGSTTNQKKYDIIELIGTTDKSMPLFLNSVNIAKNKVENSPELYSFSVEDSQKVHILRERFVNILSEINLIQKWCKNSKEDVLYQIYIKKFNIICYLSILYCDFYDLYANLVNTYFKRRKKHEESFYIPQGSKRLRLRKNCLPNELGDILNDEDDRKVEDQLQYLKDQRSGLIETQITNDDEISILFPELLE